MPHPDIRPISAAETRPLRSSALRPGQTPNELIFPGDDAPDTRHIGAFRDGEIVGIATVYREAPPGEVSQTAWRLRGMAMLPQWQRQGYGRAMVETIIAYVKEQRGTVLWCTARTSAAEFYRKLGFEVRGEEFEIPGVGPHFMMWRRVD